MKMYFRKGCKIMEKFRYFVVGYGYREDEQGYFNVELVVNCKIKSWGDIQAVKNKLKEDYSYDNAIILNWKELN